MVERYSGILDPVGGEAGDDREPPIVDPASIGNGNGGEPTGAGSEQPAKRGRGRPKGSRNRNSFSGGGSGAGSGAARASTKASLDIDGVSALLVLIHKAVSDRAQVYDENGVPVWEIGKSEGDALARAASNVVRHYDIAASQKMIDIGAALTAVVAVYMPRVAATVEAKDRKMKPATAQPIMRPVS